MDINEIMKAVSGKVVDAQVNEGISCFGPYCDILDYMYNAKKMGISEFALLPTLTQAIPQNNKIVTSPIWIKNGDKIVYKEYEIPLDNPKVIVKEASKNPTVKQNQFLSNIVDSLNSLCDFKIYKLFVVHPKLDSESCFRKLLEEHEEVIGIKIHGLSTHTSPEEWPDWIFNLASEYNKVVYIHTDYIKGRSSLSGISLKNTPQKIFERIKGYSDVTFYLAHGLRLDKKLISEINKDYDNIYIGTGPHNQLDVERNGLVNQPKINYLVDLLKVADPEKIVFSTDYRWNTLERKEWKPQWNLVVQTIEASLFQNYTKREIEQVLYKNFHKMI